MGSPMSPTPMLDVALTHPITSRRLMLLASWLNLAQADADAQGHQFIVMTASYLDTE